jgi:hypothetical protein
VSGVLAGHPRDDALVSQCLAVVVGVVGTVTVEPTWALPRLAAFATGFGSVSTQWDELGAVVRAVHDRGSYEASDHRNDGRLPCGGGLAAY